MAMETMQNNATSSGGSVISSSSGSMHNISVMMSESCVIAYDHHREQMTNGQPGDSDGRSPSPPLPPPPPPIALPTDAIEIFNQTVGTLPVFFASYRLLIERPQPRSSGSTSFNIFFSSLHTRLSHRCAVSFVPRHSSAARVVLDELITRRCSVCEGNRSRFRNPIARFNRRVPIIGAAGELRVSQMKMEHDRARAKSSARRQGEETQPKAVSASRPLLVRAREKASLAFLSLFPSVYSTRFYPQEKRQFLV